MRHLYTIVACLFFCAFTLTTNSQNQNIDVLGNAISIANGDTTPQVADNTDFGSVTIGFGPLTNIFEIENTHIGGPPGSNVLTITSITLSGANAADFTVTSTITDIERSSSQTFTIDFNPSVAGLRTALVTIVNNSSDVSEQTYTYQIQGTGLAPVPDIDVVDDTNDAIDDGGGNSPTVLNSTSFGSTDTLNPISFTYTIENNGTGALNISSVTSSNPDFAITVSPSATVAAGATTVFTVTFTPTSAGSITSIITINNDAAAPKDVYTFNVQGTGTLPPPVHTAYFHTFDGSDEGWSIITSTNDTWLRTNTFTTTDEMGEGYFWRNSAYNSYPANTNIVIESPVYDFTGLENIKFSIDIKYNTENGADGMRILYSVAGGAFVTLGASGDGTNWYEDAVTALGTDGWNNDGHSQSPSFSHSQFGRSSLTLSDATFANQSNVRFRVQFSSDASTSLEGVAFDNVLIEADPTTALNPSTIAPANVNADLRLWLKGNAGISAIDGDYLLLWEDQAYDTSLDKEDAFTVTDLAPIYRDNATQNMNYNPALDFDSSDLAYMNGKGGYFSQDYFVVFRSDDVVDTQTGSFSPGRQFPIGGRFSDDAYHEDPTGLGMGSSTARYPDEILAHNISSFPNGSGSPPNDESYGRAYSTTTDTFSNHPLIVNVKSNAARTQTEIYKNGKKIDNATGTAGNGADLNFNEFNNLQFLIGMGRSGIAGRTTSQMNGLIAEVISYSSPNSAINQQKIESYLAIKYGATLQAPGSALLDHRLNDTDYIDSQGTVIWDTSESDTFGNFYNYDVAGIGRDDASLLDQRQSRSQNDEADVTGATSGFLTISLEETYDTNNLNTANTTGLLDREFLVWGNNNASLDDPAVSITVDMSANVAGLSTPVSFESMTRVWKVKETGPTVSGTPADVGTVEVSIPKSVVRTATPPDGRYLMFISQNGEFDPTADYREMTEANDSLYVKYDFDGIEYITFGWAPEDTYSRSVYFDPAGQNYIDMEDNFDLSSGDFTVSAWIKRDASSANTSILSKRNVGYSEGYDLKINSSGFLEMSWINGTLQTITSDVVIPLDVWHHVAIIYSGSTVSMYIDGVFEKDDTFLAPVDTNSSFFVGAAAKITPEAYFHGNIDEVRVWNKALSTDELHYVMNQELENNATTIGKYFNSKSIVPTKDAALSLSFNVDLEGYYPMSTYTYTNTKDESGNQRTGSLKQLRTVDFQTAPLPYISTQAGDWDTVTTWVNGDVQTMPGDVALADNTKTVDWNIVETTHDLTMDNAALVDDGDGNFGRTVLAHVLDAGKLTVDGDVAAETGYGYTVTHYLELNGKIDLEGESQLIQSTDSDLVVGLSGELERDQQGTSNTYHYNYWSAPIGTTDTEVNEYSYAVADILKDRTFNVDFVINTYDGSPGTAGSAVKIADYWIWKFADNTDGDFSEWEHVRSTGNMLAGEGFTMKGSGDVTAYQNYTYLGKPNNSDIELSVSPYNDYLVGNPYASAIDARQFIIDNGAGIFYDDGSADPDATGNTPATNGTLYFWEHWGGGDHVLANYQGGYATYNLSGAVAAPRLDQGTNDPDVSSGGTPAKTPGHYIPVGQGFFVVGNENGGTIQFNNGQRIFKKETVASGVFMRSTETDNSVASTDEEDNRLKVKVGFNSVGDVHRQLLLTFDENTTPGVDWAYDSTTYDYQADDMFWLIEDNFYVIQASNQIEGAAYPLALYTSTEGDNTFTIDELINIPENLDVFIHDKEVDYYHNLRDGDYTVFLEAAYFDTRFEITFQYREQEQPDEDPVDDGNEEPDTDEEVAEELDPIDLGDKLDVRYANSIDKIVLMNPHSINVNSIELINLLGQSVQTIENISESGYSEYSVRDLSPGTYIIRLHTVSGSVSKKIIVN